MKKNSKKNIFLFVATLAAVLCSSSYVKAASLTYDKDYKKTGYHLEHYDTIQCSHSTGNSCYVSEESSGLTTSIPILQASFRNTGGIPGTLQFRDIYCGGICSERVSKIQALFVMDENVLGNPEYFNQDLVRSVGRPCVRLAEPYTCAMDGHAGYSYFRAYFSYCNRQKKYYYTGDAHVMYVCTAGEIGENMQAVFTYTHNLTRYQIVANKYQVSFNGNGATSGGMQTQNFTLCQFDTK